MTEKICEHRKLMGVGEHLIEGKWVMSEEKVYMCELIGRPCSNPRECHQGLDEFMGIDNERKDDE